MRAHLSPSEVTIGDRVRVEIEVTVPSAASWSAPRLAPVPQAWGHAEVLAAEAARPTREARNAYVVALTVTAFSTGTIALPPLALEVMPLRPGAGAPVTLTSPALSFTVQSVLPAGKAQPTPMPPTPPHPLPVPFAFWATLVALLVACAAVAVAVVRTRARIARPQALAPPLAPLERFLAEVAALAREPSPEYVHTGLSMALRRLVGALLHFPATERTTTEIDQQLRRSRLGMPTRRRLLDLLRRCDEVKFARRPVTRADADERVAAARALAAEVERELVPPLPQPVPAAPGGEEAA